MAPRGRDDGRPGRSGRAAVPAVRGGLAGLRERLTEVIEPVTRRAGFDLERVRVSRVGRRHSVQVIIDHDDGVGLDAIAEISREVSTALDAADESGEAVVPGEYVLEVSSPGVDRPLTEPRHWRRNVGRLVTVPGPGGPLTGRVRAATADLVVLEIGDATRELPYAQLGAGRVQIELRAADGTAADGTAQAGSGGYHGEDEGR